MFYFTSLYLHYKCYYLVHGKKTPCIHCILFIAYSISRVGAAAIYHRIYLAAIILSDRGWYIVLYIMLQLGKDPLTWSESI